MMVDIVVALVVVGVGVAVGVAVAAAARPQYFSLPPRSSRPRPQDEAPRWAKSGAARELAQPRKPQTHPKRPHESPNPNARSDINYFVKCCYVHSRIKYF